MFSKYSKWKQCIFLHTYFCALGRCISASPAGPSWHSAAAVRGTERGEHPHRTGQAPAALPLLGPHVLIMEAAESQPQQPGKVLNWKWCPWYVCKVPGPFCLGKNSLMANVLCSLTQEEQENQQMEFHFIADIERSGWTESILICPKLQDAWVNEHVTVPARSSKWREVTAVCPDGRVSS